MQALLSSLLQAQVLRALQASRSWPRSRWTPQPARRPESWAPPASPEAGASPRTPEPSRRQTAAPVVACRCPAPRPAPALPHAALPALPASLGQPQPLRPCPRPLLPPRRLAPRPKLLPRSPASPRRPGRRPRQSPAAAAATRSRGCRLPVASCRSPPVLPPLRLPRRPQPRPHPQQPDPLAQSLWPPHVAPSPQCPLGDRLLRWRPPRPAALPAPPTRHAQ
mmetsp:Transcript_1152/g.3003  ORF Transcript_1152/g.3003 Transcript_1152/m.3003 type:complete len:222 (+) Transcript_1152:1496-2161(+)